MKLRTQFVILVAGIIAVPFLVTAFMLLLRFSAARGREPMPNYEQVMSWVSHQVPRPSGATIWLRWRTRPPGLDVVVIDKGDTISSSTIPELAVGTPEATQVLLRTSARTSTAIISRSTTSHVPGDRESLVILKLPKLKPEQARFRSLVLSGFLYSSLACSSFPP